MVNWRWLLLILLPILLRSLISNRALVVLSKNNKIHIPPTVFNISTYNLVCLFTMIVWISFVILVAMVTILAGKYGLLSYQHIYVYKIEKFHLFAITTVILCMSKEPSGHQHSETAVIFLKVGLWTDI